MRLKLSGTILCAILLLSGCYLPMSGRVIDAETKQPIEGAVVLVEWTKTKGFGFTYTESYKVAETLSDKEGKFELPGCYSAFVNEPDLTIYKKGYVAWNNKIIFPLYDKRTDYIWRSGYVFRLERFLQGYSRDQHTSFIHRAINLGFGEKKLIVNAYDWEETEAFKERKSLWNK